MKVDMDNNLKLRKAIIVAIALIGTGYSLHSKALGLGEIEVKSYLGQPLLANIKVSGLDKKSDESCFSVVSDDMNAIREVKFRLKHLANEQGLLTVTSNHAVLEPIAQLTVVSQCDSTFTRQYSLLIDPSDSQSEAISNPVIDSSLSSDAGVQLSENVMTEANPVQNVAPQKKAAKLSGKRSSLSLALESRVWDVGIKGNLGELSRRNQL
jgi:Tfp pilus assembly protein FimV